LKDALANVAYHVHTLGVHLTNYLEEQSNEIKSLDDNVEILVLKMKLNHNLLGKNGITKNPASFRTYQKRKKIVKLESSDAPSKYVRKTVDLNSLNNVGVDLSGHVGSEQYPVQTSYSPDSVSNTSSVSLGSVNTQSTPLLNSTSTRATVQISQPPPSQLNVPLTSKSTTHLPQTHSVSVHTPQVVHEPPPPPPPQREEIPPPPSRDEPPPPPPTRDDPPPPPPDDDDPPPPPPSREDDDVPPPPPSRD